MNNFFNPDFQIDGDYDPVALARAERRAALRNKFDPETHCPYDRTLCRQKLVRLNDWKWIVEQRATNAVPGNFFTQGDMFHGCPVPSLNCIRRHRYEELLKRFKQKDL